MASAGRLVLVNDCLTNIPMYTMGYKMDRVRSRFFWEKVDGKQRYHMVNWPTICSPKEKGGLGVINTRIMNWCLMAKWAWKILTGQGGLWLQIYCKKYMREGTNRGRATTQKSQFAKAINKVQHLLRLGTKYKIRDGNLALFWLDVWCWITHFVKFSHTSLQ